MKLLKNQEVLKTLILELAIGAVASIVGFVFNEVAGVVAVLLTLALVVINYITTYNIIH